MTVLAKLKSALMKTVLCLLAFFLLWGWSERQTQKRLESAEAAFRAECERDLALLRAELSQRQKKEVVKNAACQLEIWSRPGSKLSALLERMRRGAM